jgi:hypothetical protein
MNIKFNTENNITNIAGGEGGLSSLFLSLFFLSFLRYFYTLSFFLTTLRVGSLHVINV